MSQQTRHTTDFMATDSLAPFFLSWYNYRRTVELDTTSRLVHWGFIGDLECGAGSFTSTKVKTLSSLLPVPPFYFIYFFYHSPFYYLPHLTSKAQPNYGRSPLSWFSLASHQPWISNMWHLLLCTHANW